jgi:type VI protein secretion system component Hcp
MDRIARLRETPDDRLQGAVVTGSSLLRNISHQVRLLALFIAAVLVAAVFLAATGGGHQSAKAPTTRYLGLRGLELAAFTGKAGIYLRIPGITAATPKPNHASDIALTGVGWNLDTPTNPTSGLPSARSTTSFTMRKQLDEFTPSLALIEVDNANEATATVYVVPTAKSSKEMLTYGLVNASVISDHQSTTTTGSTEALSWRFQKLTLTYWRNGKAVTTISYDWVLPSP